MRGSVILQNKLFNKSSMERISSPEKLNDYIQVANPSIWLILGAAILLLAAVLVWGIFGSVSTTYTVKGVASGGSIICYVNANEDIQVDRGMQVAITGDMKGTVTGEVTDVSAAPLSYVEASSGIESDYAVYALGLADWNIKTTVSADSELTEGAIYSVSITTESIRPIDLVFN